MTRRNMDESYRRAEREAATGDEAAQGRLMAAKLRAGEVRLDAVRLASILGRKDAYAVVGSPYEPDDEALRNAPTRYGPALPLDLLASLGVHDSVMWAYDTALRSLRTGAIDEPRRDALLVNSLLEWLLDEDALPVVERSRDILSAMRAHGSSIDMLRWDVIGSALGTVTHVLGINGHRAARSAVAAAGSARIIAWRAAETLGENPQSAAKLEADKQREALAKIVLWEALPFDDEGRSKPVVSNPNDEEDLHPSTYMSFMSGDCWILAVALREVTGLDVFGASDGDFVHHAFVATKPTGVGIDYRGQRSVADLISGCAGQKRVKLSDREIAKWAGEGSGVMLSATEQRGRSCPRACSAHYSDEEWEYALSEARRIVGARNPPSLPLVKKKVVWRVGPRSAPPGKPYRSLEGLGLSVSEHPEEWKQIARIGGETWMLTPKPRRAGVFLDVNRLSKRQQAGLTEAAIDEGLLVRGTRWRVPWPDEYEHDEDDDGHPRYMVFDTAAEAARENDEVEPEAIPAVIATPKLERIWARRFEGSLRGYIDEEAAWQVILERDMPELDGFWWDDELDPYGLSAPRGMIFYSRLPYWEWAKENDTSESSRNPHQEAGWAYLPARSGLGNEIQGRRGKTAHFFPANDEQALCKKAYLSGPTSRTSDHPARGACEVCRERLERVTRPREEKNERVACLGCATPGMTRRATDHTPLLAVSEPPLCTKCVSKYTVTSSREAVCKTCSGVIGGHESRVSKHQKWCEAITRHCPRCCSRPVADGRLHCGPCTSECMGQVRRTHDDIPPRRRGSRTPRYDSPDDPTWDDAVRRIEDR